jgi:hypothetical protein
LQADVDQLAIGICRGVRVRIGRKCVGAGQDAKLRSRPDTGLGEGRRSRLLLGQSCYGSNWDSKSGQGLQSGHQLSINQRRLIFSHAATFSSFNWSQTYRAGKHDDSEPWREKYAEWY